jgi:carbon-monoxide dehydrogenase large subunit
MPGSILGTRVLRVEDPELLTGHGTFVGNLRIPNMAHAIFVRSPLAHALVNSVDTSPATRCPGVLGAWSAHDLQLNPYHGFMVLNPACGRPPLATDKVRFVGEPVAVVVAESAQAAADAAESVLVDYTPLPAVVDPEAALAPGAPLQFEDMGTNLAAGFRDRETTDPLANASRVVRLRVVNQRVAVVPLEGNAIAVIPGDDGDGHNLIVYVSTQMPHGFRDNLCRLLDLDPDKVRVITPHVGGGFGAKAGVMAEHLVVTTVAKELDRPVTWVDTRSENMISMPHGRGQIDYVEIGFDDQACITGMRVRVVSDAGAYAGFGGALAIGPTRLMAQGVYRIPALHYDVAAALTNTTPMGAFRGAGRPEAAEFLERTMDFAADELGIDPVELRRRNLIAPNQFPFTTLTGARYDSGDYHKALDEALRIADYAGLRREQQRRLRNGSRLVLGIGVAVYVEVTAGGGAKEFGRVDVHEDGSATIRVGTSAHGQGHATSFAMIVSDRLGIPLDAIRFIQSDTAEVPRGGGTGGSRSLQVGGNAVRQAAEEVLVRAKELAAQELEASTADIVITQDGRIGVAGVPSRAISWARLAQLATASGEPLAAAVDFSQEGPTFPFGAHVSVVEVDLDTGAVRPVRHVAVDDCGRVINPVVVTGQQHGGIAQGMSQALWEHMRYDDHGNPLTTNLADYPMPSAAELCSLDASNTETPSPLNPLGAKGIGESGTIGSTPAVHNAVIDALSHLGIRHLDMPCTPLKIFEAVRAAEAGSLHPTWSEPPDVLSRLPRRGERPRPEAADADI